MFPTKRTTRTPTSYKCAEDNMNSGDNASLCSVRRSRRAQTFLDPSCTRTGNRRRIPNFLAIPRIVPPPCSYSRRICSNSSTLVLLSTRSCPGGFRPQAESHAICLSVGWWAKSKYRMGPNQSIEINRRLGRRPILTVKLMRLRIVMAITGAEEGKFITERMPQWDEFQA